MSRDSAWEPVWRRRATNDVPSTVMGMSAAVAVHLVVALFALRAGAAEGNVARNLKEQNRPPDEEIIEGALLRLGGGGEFDPRRVVHRQAPVRAEERATHQAGLNKNSTPQNRADSGVRRDPRSLTTEREVFGQGNQDLAERLRRLAQSESSADPAAPLGLGSPDGSVHGTETDPSHAGSGAGAKIRSFLQQHLHLLATAPASARRTFRLRIVISIDGSSLARGEVIEGSGDETVDSDLRLQITQLAENHTPIPELADEERAAIAGRGYTVRYVPE